jgi:hypothetical protein
VLLDDASANDVYSKDEYVRQKRSKSILCQRRLNIPQFPPVENSPIAPVEISPGAERL